MAKDTKNNFGGVSIQLCFFFYEYACIYIIFQDILYLCKHQPFILVSGCMHMWLCFLGGGTVYWMTSAKMHDGAILDKPSTARFGADILTVCSHALIHAAWAATPAVTNAV